MRRMRFLLWIPLILCLLLGCSDSDEPKVSFSEVDFSAVHSVLLVNMHNGTQSYIDDAESVAEICAFLSTVRGEDGTSAKGYYEGSYGVALYANPSASAAVLEEETPIVSIGFGDSNAFYYGKFEDGYPVRYSLVSNIIEEVISFFKQYDQNILS